MGSWLRKLSVSNAAQSAVPPVGPDGLTPTPAARGGARLGPAAPVVGTRCEPLESRTFLSAAPLDVTNSYGGSVTFKAGKAKAKEAITVTLTSQSAAGFVSGQIDSDHLGTVNVQGKLTGKTLWLAGATADGVLNAKVGSKGKVLAGSVTNAIDDSVGKFKIKLKADAPAAEGLRAAGGPRAVPLAATGSGALDPGIDPTTGLPIDPVTGLPIDPGATPGDSGDPIGGGVPAGPSAGPTPTPTTPGQGGGVARPSDAADPGTLIGNNRSFLGIWQGTFNNDGTGSISDPNDPANVTPVNGVVPGTDPRDVTFSTPNQDQNGLVSGSLNVAGFGTYDYTGYVLDAHIDLVLTGTYPGATNGTLSLDLDPTTNYSSFTGHIDAFSNGFEAVGPINAAFTGNVPTPTAPLPAGAELYNVSQTQADSEPTIGNFDPQGASVGMDFAVGLAPVVVNSLGTFDSLGDGLAHTIRVAIFNVATGTQVVAANITNDNSSLAPGSQFRYLLGGAFTPVTLQTGVYRIVAFGYEGNDLAADIGDDSYQGPVPNANPSGTIDVQFPISNSLNANNYLSTPNGGGNGGGNNGGGTGGTLTYPTLELGLPLNRFLAGSMLFEVGTATPTPTPTPIPTPTPTPTIIKPGNSAFPGGVVNTATGPEVFGSQSGNIIT